MEHKVRSTSIFSPNASSNTLGSPLVMTVILSPSHLTSPPSISEHSAAKKV